MCLLIQGLKPDFHVALLTVLFAALAREFIVLLVGFLPLMLSDKNRGDHY